MLHRADYYAFRRLSHQPADLSGAGEWDLFLSAYEDTERVQTPFDSVQAKRKQVACTKGIRHASGRMPGKTLSCWMQPTIPQRYNM